MENRVELMIPRLAIYANRAGRARLAPLIAFLAVCLGVIGVGGVLLTTDWKPGKTTASDRDEHQSSQMGGDFVQVPSVLADGIFMLGRSAPSVVYVVGTSAGLLLVDAGLEEDGSGIAKQLSELNLTIDDTRAILLTHAHGDHTYGARRISAMTGAKIYAGAGDASVLRAAGPREAIFSTFPMDGYVIHPTRIDVELNGGEVLEFGDTRINVIATPGHTPGSICYLVQRGNLRVLLGGDTISSLVGDLGIYATYLPPKYRANAKDYLDSLKKLRAIPAPDLVLPGHPFNPNLPSNPRLSETEWHQLLDRGIRELEALVARYEADGKDFIDGEPKEMLPGLHYFGNFKEYPVFAYVTAERILLFDAPGGPELADFVEEKLSLLGEKASLPKAVLLTSCEDETLAGLESLVQRFQCAVAASPEGHFRIVELCPSVKDIMTLDDLKAANWFSVDPVPLSGRGIGPAAYYFSTSDRNVLISGKMPVPISDKNVFALSNDLSVDPDNSWRYRESLQTLGELKPDLWLTAIPQSGQNANLYGLQWSDLIKQNLNLLGGQ